jgi:hypothetical protein
MKTIRAMLTGAALAALVLTAAAPPAGAATRNKCRVASTASGTKIVKRSSSGVVFTTRRGGVRGCLYRGGGPVAELLDEGGGINLGRGQELDPQLAGRYFAYSTYGSAIGDEYDRVVVWDLGRGRVLFEVGSNSVFDLVLKRNGSVAWIQYSVVAPADTNRTVFEVHEFSVVDRVGDLLLDRGDDIASKSLELSDDRAAVLWSAGGAGQRHDLR